MSRFSHIPNIGRALAVRDAFDTYMGLISSYRPPERRAGDGIDTYEEAVLTQADILYARYLENRQTIYPAKDWQDAEQHVSAKRNADRVAAEANERLVAMVERAVAAALKERGIK